MGQEFLRWFAAGIYYEAKIVLSGGSRYVVNMSKKQSIDFTCCQVLKAGMIHNSTNVQFWNCRNYVLLYQPLRRNSFAYG